MNPSELKHTTALDAVLEWNVRTLMSLRQEITKEKRQIALARIEALDTEHIGMIDGSAYAEKIKKLARHFADMPLNKDILHVDTVIHLLDKMVSVMPEFKEDKHE